MCPCRRFRRRWHALAFPERGRLVRRRCQSGSQTPLSPKAEMPPGKGVQGRMARGGMAAFRRACVIHSPASRIHWRRVAADRTPRWRSANLSAAHAGPKLVPRPDSRAAVLARRHCGGASRAHGTPGPGRPRPESAAGRPIWRTSGPSRPAASRGRICPPPVCCRTPARSTSFRLIVRSPPSTRPLPPKGDILELPGGGITALGQHPRGLH